MAMRPPRNAVLLIFIIFVLLKTFLIYWSDHCIFISVYAAAGFDSMETLFEKAQQPLSPGIA
jgi:hypothetical protein